MSRWKCVFVCLSDLGPESTVCVCVCLCSNKVNLLGHFDGRMSNNTLPSAFHHRNRSAQCDVYPIVCLSLTMMPSLIVVVLTLS